MSNELDNIDLTGAFDDDEEGLDALAEEAEDDGLDALAEKALFEDEKPEDEKQDFNTGKIDISDISARDIVNEVFALTDIKTTENDPLIIMMMLNQSLFRATKDNILKDLQASQKLMIKEVENKHTDSLKVFNDKIAYLEKILSKLDSQKDAIVQDVWSKSQDIMYDRTKTTMQKAINELVKESQGSVNNERNLLIGAFGGLILGLILAVILNIFLN